MLVDREVDDKLLLERIASYLVLSTTSKLGNCDQIWNLVAFNRATVRRHEVIVHCIMFGVEHDEPLVPSIH